MFKAAEVFDVNFASIYSNAVHIVCVVSICLTCLLIYVIIAKTPPFMSNLKIYFIPYCINIVVIKFVFAVYTPICLHPFLYFYPAGIAKNFPIKLSLTIVAFGIFSALSLIDCCIGILIERGYALRAVETLTTAYLRIRLPCSSTTVTIKPPLMIFLFLTLSSLVCFICGIITIFSESFYSAFFVLPENIPAIINSKIIGLGDILDFNVIVVVQSTEQTYVPYLFLFACLLALSHLIIATQLIFYNFYKSRSIKYLMSTETKRNNTILLRMTYFQFLGFFLFLGCPVLIICLTYSLKTTPTMFINYCIVVMNCFSIYDTIITIFCIKPYRMFVFSLFKKRIFNKKQITVVIPTNRY